LSSTIERGERGQILVIFAVSLFIIFGVAALVFDGGMMLLEKRTQQNAADAASLAGARFLPDNLDDAARLAAREVATANGYTDGEGNVTVDVNWPPENGPHTGDTGYIEVLIDNERPSLFAGIWGIFDHDVGSRAVAANDSGVLGPFGMLSLEETDCSALKVGGAGEIISNGDIQVNSSCTNKAMFLTGTGEIVTAPGVACNVTGDFSASGGFQYSCEPHEGVQAIPDPLAGLAEPPYSAGDPPAYLYPPEPDEVVGAMDIPTGCPGSDAPATHESPQLCQFTASYDGTIWRLYPGYYPGGLQLQGGEFYLEPGIYYMGGGGIQMNGGSVTVTSVDAGAVPAVDPGTGDNIPGGGVLLFNGDHPTGAIAPGPVTLNGGDSGVRLLPLSDGSDWDGIVIFQDRAVCLDVTLNGGDSGLVVRGLIYAPCAEIKANGNGGGIVTDQLIANTYDLTGNGGGINVMFDEDYLPTFTVAGLIE
jgi:hypothetical protein